MLDLFDIQTNMHQFTPCSRNAQYGLGDRIRERRQELNMTQAELARLLFMSRSSIARLETNRSSLYVDTARALKDSLGVNWEFFD